MAAVLLNHMITGVWFSAGLQDGATLTSEADQSLVIGLSGDVTHVLCFPYHSYRHPQPPPVIHYTYIYIDADIR